MASLFPYNHPRIVAVIVSLAALAAFSALCPPHAEAGGVIVVKSADLKPYREVLRGFKDSCGCPVEELQVRGREDREKILLKSPDAVVAIGTSVFKLARDIKDIPVIYTMAMPSETSSIRQPNISGVSMDLSPEAYLTAMRELFSRVTRIGILYDPQNTGAYVSDAAQAAQAAGIELVTKQVRDASKIPAALDELQGKIDVLWMLPDPAVATDETVELLLRFSFQHAVPVFSFAKKYVEMGAVASLDVDPYNMGVQAAEILSRVAAGHSGAMRVYARKSHLSINRNVAAKMGLKIKDNGALKKVNGDE
jgi:putative ABC transport system substrate-binding protein